MTFKAKLISDTIYYKYKYEIWILTIAMTITAITLQISAYSENAWLSALFVILYLVSIVFLHKYTKKLKKLNNKTITIDKNEIIIHGQKNQKKSITSIDNCDKLIVSKALELIENGNKKHKNYITIIKDDKTQKFYFEIDSHYMVKQLNKLITHWESDGLIIQRE